MTDNDNTSDNPLYNIDQRRRGMATRARTREDTSGNIGSLGLEGGSLSAVIPGSHEAPRPLARSLDPSKPHRHGVLLYIVAYPSARPTALKCYRMVRYVCRNSVSLEIGIDRLQRPVTHMLRHVDAS